MTGIVKVLLLALVLCVSTAATATLAYRSGCEHARALARAELAQRLAREQEASAERLRAENARFQEEARRAFLTDFALQKERNFYAQEKQKLMVRIPTLARGACLLGPDAVGLWNEAIGAPGSALPGTAHTAGSDATPRRAGASGAGCAGRRQ